MANDFSASFAPVAGMSFTDNKLDRHAPERNNTAWVQGQFASTDARFIITTRGKVVLDAATLSIRHERVRANALGMQDAEVILLGTEGEFGRPLVAFRSTKTEEELEQDSALKLVELRALALQGSQSREDLGILAQTRSMLHWHATHGYCSCCGGKTTLEEAGYRRECPSCRAQHFPRTDPVVIMLVTHGDKVLLGRSPRLDEGVITTLAGFMEPGETVEDAVRRETWEESRIKVGKVQIVGNQPWPFPANLMLGCRAEALTTDISISQDELQECRWCDRDEVRRLMSDTHEEGFRTPPPLSIAYRLISGWMAEE